MLVYLQNMSNLSWKVAPLSTSLTDNRLYKVGLNESFDRLEMSETDKAKVPGKYEIDSYIQHWRLQYEELVKNWDDQPPDITWPANTCPAKGSLGMLQHRTVRNALMLKYACFHI